MNQVALILEVCRQARQKAASQDHLLQTYRPENNHKSFHYIPISFILTFSAILEASSQLHPLSSKFIFNPSNVKQFVVPDQFVLVRHLHSLDPPPLSALCVQFVNTDLAQPKILTSVF